MNIAGLDLMELGRKQAVLFGMDNVAYCEVLVTCYAPRTILDYAYHKLVRQGKMLAKEDLLVHQKEGVRKIARDIAKKRLGKKAFEELIHSLLALEYFLNL